MKRLHKYIVIARVSLANAIAYRASVVSRMLFYTLFIYVFMSLWRAIYREGAVHGYSYNQIVWYLIMTEMVAFSLRTGIYAQMNDDVRSGAIAYQIGRPVHYVLFQYATCLGESAFNLVAFGSLAAALGLIFVGPLATLSLASAPAVLLSMLLGLTIQFFFQMMIGLLSFIMEDNFAFFLIYQKLVFMLGMFLPVEFLPDWLQSIAKALPFSYVCWAPAKLFVNFSPELAARCSHASSAGRPRASRWRS